MSEDGDPYDHPPGVNCVYIHTSIHHCDEVYAVACSCDARQPCVTADCPCVKTSGLNYRQVILVDDKLNESGSSIFECNDSCGCGDRCENRVSQSGPCTGLLIEPCGIKGYGVFAQRTIPKGTFVCEYAGEVLSEGGMRTRAAANDADWRYVITLNEVAAGGSTVRTFIDATNFGNVGRYLNHSCSPNCILVPIRYESAAPKVGIFAVRDIAVGEECCYLYAHGDGERSDTPCLCGSDTCRRYLPLGCFKRT